ncbi:MAG TPA: YggS family pyridoxal phosphate-dependent enzyme, partial [Flavisolibacter sp.]|nr:YggS family pyridoxal phosphate-dependent enzyme [Flavisolibacter sp.]
ILALYELGHRDFGENYVQELVEKQQQLPGDIRWHFIGHLQTNKVKYLAPFVHLIHGVDSLKLADEINKQGKKNGRVLDILFQIHIAVEETKFGFDESELKEAIQLLEKDSLSNTRIRGLMGMASFTNDQKLILNEFRSLKNLFDQFKHSTTSQIEFDTLSMGMSSDYQQALEEGSTMIRVGSLIFGERNYI